MSVLSNELFFNVHRGLGGSKVNRPLGIHWSRDKDMATIIGAHNATTGHNTVLHGQLPLSSVETNVENLKKMGWDFSEEDVHHWLKKDPLGEQEVMAKKGSPVLVTGQTKYRLTNNSWKKRTRTYNPPREMQA